MATLNTRSLPPYAEIVAVEKSVSIANFGGNYIAWPYVWVASYNGGVTDHSASNPWGYTTSELLDQYTTVDIIRGFYPPANRLYDQTSKIGALNMHWFLKLLDFWQAKSKKFHWSISAYNGAGAGAAIWTGYSQDAVGGNNGEQALVNFINDLFGSFASTSSNNIQTGAQTFTIPTGLTITSINKVKIYQTSNTANFIVADVTSYTSGTGALVINGTSIGGSGTGITDWSIKYCSPAGLTLAEHPALYSIEVSGEQITSTAVGAAYARATRIVAKLFAQYKPSVKILRVTSNAGSRFTAPLEASSAVTINALTTNGDDGTGKQACDYGYGMDCHYYHFNSDTAVLHDAGILTNEFCSRYNRANKGRHYGSVDTLTKYNASSRIFGTNRDSIVQWCTEWGMIGTATDPRSGGWGWFMASKIERFNNLIRSLLPVLFATQDGAGGLGVVFCYGFDGGGINGAGSSGTITNTTAAAHTDGSVKVTLSGSPLIPFSSTVRNQSITITAGAGGWSDLGLSAAQTKRFVMSQVTGNTVTLQGTTFTAQPASSATYKEYQTDWGPYTEELAPFVSLLSSGLVSFGWINYPNSTYQGIWFNVKGVGTWYTTSTSEVRQW